jgi:hypothetical protein
LCYIKKWLTDLGYPGITIGLYYLGMELGSKWNQVKEIAAPYVNQVAVVAAILIAGYFLFNELKKQLKQQS